MNMDIPVIHFAAVSQLDRIDPDVKPELRLVTTSGSTEPSDRVTLSGLSIEQAEEIIRDTRMNIATFRSDFKDGVVTLIGHNSKSHGLGLSDEEANAISLKKLPPLASGLQLAEGSQSGYLTHSFLFRVDRPDQGFPEINSRMNPTYKETTRQTRYYVVTYQVAREKLFRPLEKVNIRRILPPTSGELPMAVNMEQQSGWDEVRWTIDRAAKPIYYERHGQRSLAVKQKLKKYFAALTIGGVKANQDSISINTLSNGTMGMVGLLKPFDRMKKELMGLQRQILQAAVKPETPQ